MTLVKMKKKIILLQNEKMTMKQIEQSLAMFRKSCTEKTGVESSKIDAMHKGIFPDDDKKLKVVAIYCAISSISRFWWNSVISSILIFFSVVFFAVHSRSCWNRKLIVLFSLENWILYYFFSVNEEKRIIRTEDKEANRNPITSQSERYGAGCIGSVQRSS